MADASFVIDGVDYPIPGLDSFDMDEAVILYEHCKLSVEDFAIDDEDPEEVEELAEKTKHPGFVKALMIVAYMRGNRGVKRNKAEVVIGKSNLMDAYEAFIDAGGEEDPTEAQKTSESSEASSASSSGNGAASGSDSDASSAAEMTIPASTPPLSVVSSDAPAENPEPTGMPA